MEPVLRNIRIQRGEILALIATVRPAPVNITGWTIQFTMKANYDDVAAVISKNAVLTDPTNGEFSLTFSHSETNITPRAYVYDIWRTDGGSEIVLGKGDFVIEPEVKY